MFLYLFFFNQKTFLNMKKTSIFLIVFFFGIIINGFSQTSTTSDFFVGKWEITILGTSSGDSNIKLELKLVEAKLVAELIGAKDGDFKIEEVWQEADKLMIDFSVSGMAPRLELEKVDSNNLKGSLMSGRFDAKAIRMKQ